MSDVGVSVISYKEQRIRFVDYSPPVGLDGAVWFSKLPRKLPSATNLVRTFDSMSWLAIAVSMLVVSLFLTLVSYLGTHYGTGSRDYCHRGNLGLSQRKRLPMYSALNELQ